MKMHHSIRNCLSGLLLSGMGISQAQPAAAETQWCSVPVSQSPSEKDRLLASLQPNRYRAPAPVSRLHTEGTLPHQGIFDQSVVAKEDFPLMQNAALTWRITGDDTWSSFARRYVLAWVETYKPSFNPIDETGFDALIETYAIIQPTLSEKENHQVRQYFRQWAEGYLQSMLSHKHSSKWFNNWESHRVKLVTLIADALNDPSLLNASREAFQDQVSANIAPNGETLDFRERDAIHYAVYDIQPLVQAALAARMKGEDWYHWKNSNGASLENAVRWLTPFISGQKKHEEFVHSSQPFDAARAQAGMKGYSGVFDPRAATTLYWLLSELDPSLQPLARQLGKPPFFITFCGR